MSAGPVIRSEPVAHHEAFSITTPVLAGGEQLRPGNYEAAWKGLGPRVQVSILRRGKPVASVPATLVAAAASSPGGKPVLRNNADGSWSLQLVRFPGRTYALRFE
jgi:hypothetical protein